MCELEIQSSNERHVTPLPLNYVLSTDSIKLLNFYKLKAGQALITITRVTILYRYLHECNKTKIFI